MYDTLSVVLKKCVYKLIIIERCTNNLCNMYVPSMRHFALNI